MVTHDSPDQQDNTWDIEMIDNQQFRRAPRNRTGAAHDPPLVEAPDRIEIGSLSRFDIPDKDLMKYMKRFRISKTNVNENMSYPASNDIENL